MQTQKEGEVRILNKLTIALISFLMVLVNSTAVLAREGNSGHEDGRSEDRVRIEVRANEDEPGENRVRFEARDNGSRVRIEARDADEATEEAREELPGVEITGNTFEITGMVTAFTGGTVTINGRMITINPSSVTNFEQEGTITVGETIKVEGMVAADGTLLAREIKADGTRVEEASASSQMTRVNLEGNLDRLTALFNQILALLRSMM